MMIQESHRVLSFTQKDILQIHFWMGTVNVSKVSKHPKGGKGNCKINHLRKQREEITKLCAPNPLWILIHTVIYLVHVPMQTVYVRHFICRSLNLSIKRLNVFFWNVSGKKLMPKSIVAFFSLHSMFSATTASNDLKAWGTARKHFYRYHPALTLRNLFSTSFDFCFLNIMMS